jgi:PAS domain S-box-containing protein
MSKRDSRAESDLRASEILESMTEGFFAVDREWRFTYVNRAAHEILEREPRDLLGKNVWAEYPGLLGTEFERAYRQAMAERKQVRVAAYYPEDERWYEVKVYPQPDGIAIYFRNVTEEKRAEQERSRLIVESERQRRMYEAALSNTPDFVYIFDPQHRFTYVNEALLRMWGKTRAEAIGRTCLELGYEPWHAEMHNREIDQVVATRRPIRGEVPFTGTDGRRIYDYIFVPVFGPGDEVVAVAGTTRDVTERKQNEQSIREQAEKLRDADCAKDEFIATLSHELRNPLAPLLNSLQLLRLTGVEDPTVTRVQEMMERQVHHLMRLVDDLLEMARISRGTLNLRRERVELASVVRNAVETCQPLIQAADHRLALALPPEPIWLEGDAVRLAQILANLLNNAAKYTPDGGCIWLSALRVDEREVAISVRDDGAGIPPEQLPRMFEMFSRGERPGARGQGGLGIGLALARRLAEMHGGTLIGRSEGLGRGAEFILRVPLAADQTNKPAAGMRTPERVGPTRILVVDDNADAAESLGLLLRFLGADVLVAHDGNEALEEFGDYDPAVVLLDIGMPGMDGYEVARHIRTRFPERKPALVALTGWGQENDRQRAREAGFDQHMIKPAELTALQKLLATLQSSAASSSPRAS